jgi:anthranilate phosphoribosyltransferase
MTFPDLVQPLIERKDLSEEQAIRLMRHLMSGEATEAQIGGVLLGLRIKGCTTRELASFAKVLREHATAVPNDYHDLVDTCGTGGGIPSFNISTAAAIVASAAGVRIAKHGNRAVTSKCGSADVLEHLGVRIGGESESLAHMLEVQRIVFLFAPAHHPAMRFVGKARKELGLRTVFNQLGPLANPAGASRQLIGVYDAALMRSMAEALRLLGSERVLIVHGDDGLDEISPCATTEYVKVWDGRVSTGKFSPSDFGLAPLEPRALEPADDCVGNAAILREAISDLDSPRARAILPSAAAAIWISGLEDDLLQAVERASAAISTGRASEKLEELIVASEGE